MNTALQPILSILDEGLRLYRRHFVRFLLITAALTVPTAGLFGLTIALSVWLGPLASLLIIAWLLLALPLGTYLLATISRATAAAQRGQAIQLGEVLAVAPLRLLGMSVFTLVFYLLSNTVISSLMLCVFCPLYLVGVTLIGGVFGGLAEVGAAGQALLVVLGAVATFLLVLVYAVSVALGGATYAGLAYGLQPFALEQLSFGRAIQRSFDLLGYCFWRNLLAFVVTSIVFGALSTAVTIAVVTCLSLPLLAVFGPESLLAQGMSAAAWMLGLMVVLPPLPIWMTLWYQRNVALRDANDLETRIAALVGPPPFIVEEQP